MPEGHPAPGFGALAALLLFIVGSVWLGTLAQRALARGSFLKGYFLGNRGLGAWALALTATVQSGGTFMGFPSLVYSHGWVVAIWIASYMVVPITGFGVIGKRLAHLSRRTGAITVPDLFRERFGSPVLGLLASLFMMLFLSAMMIAQFKAGALVMKISWPGTGSLALSEDVSDYALTTPALNALANSGVPPGVVEKLQPLRDQSFADEKAFQQRLADVLTSAELEQYRVKIVKEAEPIDWLYYAGLGIFALTVIGYTLIGGFLAAVWTDLFQSVMMFLGVVVLLCLAIPAAGGLESATRQAMANTSEQFALGPGYARDGREFLPLGLAVSFWTIWVMTGVASPAGMVRIMASKSTDVLRRSMCLLSVYNFFIYLPLIAICICARALMPDLAKSDEVIPRMALLMTSDLPLGSFLGGLILAAPFGAVMATVSGYLVVIASGLVRDVYQRFINPQANEYTIKRLSYGVMIGIGLVALALNIRPVAYLQALVVFSGTGAAATFVVAALMACYWRRATAAGTMAAMIAGAGTMLVLYLIGFFAPDPMIGQATQFRPYFLAGLDPLLWGLAASLVAGVVGSCLSPSPDAARVSRLFDVEPHTDC
jgi:SSS family solute:Na+ symporter/sodium/pantothenate symporter